MTTSPTVLSLEGVSKRFGDATAVDKVSLAAAAGEYLTLLGPSGSGKSTLLRMIAGLESLTDGVVKISDVDVSTVPPWQRNIGIVFQNYSLFPHMSVSANVEYPLRMRGVRRPERRRAAADALERVGLKGYGGRRPRELSGGQQQRVALARAVVHSPDLVLLDEPLSALDRNLREEMRDWLGAIHAELQLTFVHVTHDQEEAISLGNRVAVMNDGRLQQIDSAESVFTSPASPFVGGFFGGNVVDARVERVDGEVATVSVAGVALPVRTRDQLAIGDTGTVYLRPEAMAVGAAGTPSTGSTLSADLRSLTYLGTHVGVVVELDTGARLNLVIPADHTFPDGMPLGTRVSVNVAGDAWFIKSSNTTGNTVGER